MGRAFTARLARRNNDLDVSEDEKILNCGCRVRTGRDFLGRVVGTVIERGPSCARDDHVPGRVVLMPGRESARPE